MTCHITSVLRAFFIIQKKKKRRKKINIKSEKEKKRKIKTVSVPASYNTPVPNISSIMIIMTWFYAQLTGLICRYSHWQRSESMLEQSQWVNIILGCISIQVSSNNKYAEKNKYKWVVNMYEYLTIDLFHLHLPMALNAHSFGFHMVSCKYIPSYAIFYDRVEQFHNATWVGVNSDWISQLLYEWQKFMNNTYPPILDVPIPFSNLGKSQIILLTCLFWSCSRV